MERFNWSGVGPDLATLLDAAAVIYPETNDLVDEYLTLLWAHPGFQEARQELRQEMDELEEHDFRFNIQDARRGPGHPGSPITRFAEQWGISPAAAHVMALPSSDLVELPEDEVFQLYRREARAIIVNESDSGFSVFLPRPLLSEDVDALASWLKDQKSGRVEELWGRSGKKRWQPQGGVIAELTRFKQWNEEHVEPTDIWKAEHAKNPKFEHDAFLQRLTRLWERMREISPDKIRPDRPSKAFT
jgi:hypothetical protein